MSEREKGKRKTVFWNSKETESPGGGNDNSLQNSSLGNHMDRGVWQATVNGVTKESDMT